MSSSQGRGGQTIRVGTLIVIYRGGSHAQAYKFVLEQDFRKIENLVQAYDIARGLRRLVKEERDGLRVIRELTGIEMPRGPLPPPIRRNFELQLYAFGSDRHSIIAARTMQLPAYDIVSAWLKNPQTIQLLP